MKMFLWRFQKAILKKSLLKSIALFHNEQHSKMKIRKSLLFAPWRPANYEAGTPPDNLNLYDASELILDLQRYVSANRHLFGVSGLGSLSSFLLDHNELSVFCNIFTKVARLNPSEVSLSITNTSIGCSHFFLLLTFSTYLILQCYSVV